MASQAPFSFSAVVNGEVNQYSEQQQSRQDILSSAFGHGSDSLNNGPDFNNFAPLQANIDRHLQGVDQFLDSQKEELLVRHHQGVDQFLDSQKEELLVPLRQQANDQFILLKHVLDERVAFLLCSKDNELAMVNSKLEAALAALRARLCENAIIKRDLREVSTNYQVALQKLEIAEQSNEAWRQVAVELAASVEELKKKLDQVE